MTGSAAGQGWIQEYATWGLFPSRLRVFVRWKPASSFSNPEGRFADYMEFSSKWELWMQ
jgi:hypothetical protein